LIIEQLQLKNFRNLNLTVDFSTQVNFIIGQNASGKSNFLDALNFLYRGESFKPFGDTENINWDEKNDFALLTAKFQENSNAYKVVFSPGTNTNIKKFLINEKSTTRKNFIKNKSVVVFSPHHLNIIAGVPEDRRSDLDKFLIQIDFHYENILKRYKQIITNRNRLLEKIQAGFANESELIFWNEKLVEAGSLIIQKRLQLFQEFDPVLDASAEELFHAKGDFTLSYHSKIAIRDNDISTIEQSFAAKLAENSYKEIAAGRTLYGPQRDDWEMHLDGNSIKIYASRGQQRIASLILKYAQWKFLSEKTEQTPVILLDDIFSELDQENAANLKNFFLKLDTQLFFTSITINDHQQKSHLETKIIKLD